MESTFATFILLFTYALAIMPFAYILSINLSKRSNVQVAITSILFLLGFVLVIISNVLDQVDSTKDTNESLKKYYRISPGFALGEGLLNMCMQELYSVTGMQSYNPLNYDITGRNIAYLVITSISFFLILLLIEYNFFGNILSSASLFGKNNKNDEYNNNLLMNDMHNTNDIDVITESKRVQDIIDNNNFDVGSDILLFHKLSKKYPNNIKAVNNLSLGIYEGQVTAFLGENGAGKTTTLKMITGDVSKTSGNIYLKGKKLIDNNKHNNREIGWCPQQNPIIEVLSAREHLELLSKIRQVPTVLIPSHVDTLISLLSLDKFADRRSGTYSGGNKRKLSLGMALVGSPTVLLLDEPSSGLDPISRRYIWDTIANIHNKCILLTSHVIEECEALCQRVAIIKKGKLKCIGSVPKMKDKFSQGYKLFIQLKQNSDKANILNLIKDNIKGSKLYNIFNESFDLDINNASVISVLNNPISELCFQLPKNIKLSEVYVFIEKNRDIYNITEFYISQASLEDVFFQVNQDN